MCQVVACNCVHLWQQQQKQKQQHKQYKYKQPSPFAPLFSSPIILILLVLLHHPPSQLPLLHIKPSQGSDHWSVSHNCPYNSHKVALQSDSTSKYGSDVLAGQHISK